MWLYLCQFNLQKDSTSKNGKAAKEDKKEKRKGKVCLSLYAIFRGTQ